MRISGRISVITTIVLSMVLVITPLVSAAPYDLGKHDLNGATVTFVWWGNYFKETDFEMLERKEMAEKEFNCKIEMLTLPWSGYSSNLMARLLSGDSKYDLWTVHSDFFWQIVGQDAFYPVSNALPADYFTRWGAAPFPATFKGITYGFSNPTPSVDSVHVMFFNKTLFEREGLESPYDLVANGEWTWDKVTELAKRATKDTDGDGATDQWGIVNITELTVPFGYSNNARPERIDETGRVAFNYDSPEAIETLTQIYEWVSVDKVARSWDAALFEQGKAALVINPAQNAKNYMKMQDDFGIVPLPIGPSATEFTYPPSGGSSWVLPKNSADPIALIALWDFLFEQRYPEGHAQAALEEKLATWVKDRESYETLLEINRFWTEKGSNDVFEYRWLFLNKGGLHTQGYYKTASGELTPATAMEELKPAIQAILDEVLRQ